MRRISLQGASTFVDTSFDLERQEAIYHLKRSLMIRDATARMDAMDDQRDPSGSTGGKNNMGLKMKAEEYQGLEPGSYEGRFESFEVRTHENKDTDETYTYLDVGIAVETDDGTISEKAGFSISSGLTPKTDLGKLLKRFGVDVKSAAKNGDEIDVEAELEGKNCKFVVEEHGDFTRVDRDTIVPA